MLERRGQSDSLTVWRKEKRDARFQKSFTREKARENKLGRSLIFGGGEVKRLM